MPDSTKNALLIKIENELNTLRRNPFPRARRNFDFYAEFDQYDDFVFFTASNLLENRRDKPDFSFQTQQDVELNTMLRAFKPSDEKDVEAFKKVCEYKKQLDTINELIKRYYNDPGL